ncbi:twin-arginine translocase TatA/TatE family subunit [SAR202 cluster bacterium AC-409-J13_OGT_754m]|nr:twin-arginine translocase TatA/TatE family subunit [SAR202 cluster bacterium AC-409-J13_OGT_754m]
MRVPGPWELAIILAIVLVVFGAGRLPQIGSSLGRGMRAFRRGINGADDSIDETLESTDKSENKD